MAIKERSRRASGRKRDAKGSTFHAEIKLPLVSSGQPGTIALDNVRIFESIPFP